MKHSRVKIEVVSSSYRLPGCVLPTQLVEVRISLLPRRRGLVPLREVHAASNTLEAAVRAAVKAFRRARRPEPLVDVRAIIAAARRSFRPA